MAVPADWDFDYSLWDLYTPLYISAPSSLRLRCPGLASIRAICKKAGTLNMEQGRIVTYLRSPTGASFWPTVIFRHQTAPGATTPLTFYHVEFRLTAAYLCRYTNAAATNLGAFPVAISNSNNVWYKYRVTWYLSYNEQNQPTLAVHLEYWNGTAWDSKGILYDTTNQGAGSGTNRSGVGARNNHASSQLTIYHDDTEIWTPA